MQLNGILPSRVVLSYIFDYCIIIFLIIAFSALDKAEPHHQNFSVHNKSLQYPFADPERIPPWLAALVSCAFPILVIILYTMVIDGMFSHHKNAAGRRDYSRHGVYTLQERLWEMNAGILGLGLSVAGTITITGALKNLTGKPRPDVLARCKPIAGWIEPDIGLSSSDICTGDPYILRDGFKSWPSGHSSIAFAGLGYLSIYLSGKLHILDNRGEVWKTFLVLIPMLAASMVAISRIMDARHHPFDVISSSILGMFLAWVSYRQYFPSLHETWKKGRAFPIRSWGRDPPPPVDDNNGFLRSADEEEGGVKGGFKGNRALASSLPEDEITAGQRRRQYLEDQEMLERRRRRTHDFYDEYTGPNQSQSALPPQITAYHPTASHDPEDEEVGSIEMRERKVTRAVEPTYQPYMGGQPNRQYTQSTNDSNEIEDHKRAIAAATNAVDPITKTGGYMRGTESSDDGFVQVNTGPKRVDS